MYNFDSNKYKEENKFAKNNAGLLKHFFETSDVESYWIADMDFEIAPEIKEEMMRIAERNVYCYEFSTTELNKAICQWFNRRHDLHLKPNHFAQVPSVLTGIAVLLRQFTNTGDGVLIQTPVYHQFSHLIKSNQRTIVENPLINTGGHYTMDYDNLETHFKSGKVKMMIMCNPHNPVGRVWKREELQRVIDLADQYQVKVISDEIHADIIYAGHTFQSILSLGAENHFAMLGSTAKTFGMQSISNGFIYIPSQDNLVTTKEVVTGMFLDHGSTYTTFATIAAYEKGEPWLHAMMIYLQEILDWIDGFVKKNLPEVKIIPVEGTYQMWLDFSGLELTTEELKRKIVQEGKLGLAFGDWYDKTGGHDQFARFNFASPKEKIEKAFKTLKEALTK